MIIEYEGSAVLQQEGYTMSDSGDDVKVSHP